MSGQTAACRARYSASRSGRTWRVKQARGTGFLGSRGKGPPAAAGRDLAGGGRRDDSEVEVVDVVGVEHGRLAEDDDAVLLDRVLAEVTGLERLALVAGDLPG